jgi:RNA polymerase sporulation-specific sigma factor
MENSEAKLVELINNAKRGNKDAINEIMYIYSPFVKKIVRYYGIVLNREDKEDLFIEGLLALQRSILSFDALKNNRFDDFAFIAVKNTVLDFLRKKKKIDSNITYGEIVETDQHDFEQFLFLKDEIDEFSKKLSSFEKEVLKVWLQGYGVREIAQRLDKPYKSIDNALQRIKKHFKQFFFSE